MTKPSRSLSNGRDACLGIVVARAHGSHGAEAADADRNDRRFGAAGEHDLGVAHFDGAPGFADGVVGGGAGRTGGEVRAAQLVVHREQARSHVRDEHRDHERRKPARPAFEQDLVLLVGRLQAADAGADKHADFVAVGFVEIQAGIAQRLPAGIDAELANSDRCGGLPWAKETRASDRNPYLGGDLDVELRGVERGNPVDAAFAGDQVVPKGVDVVAQGETTPKPVTTTLRSVQLLAIN